jgi:hypothetical protein
MGKAVDKDLEQLEKYATELGTECIASVLIAKEFTKNVVQKVKRENNRGLNLMRYDFKNLSTEKSYTFEQLKSKLEFQEVNM